MYPREMETGSKERDGGGEGKSLAYERGSVRLYPHAQETYSG